MGWGTSEKQVIKEVMLKLSLGQRLAVGLGMKGMPSWGKCHGIIGKSVWGAWSRYP